LGVGIKAKLKLKSALSDERLGIELRRRTKARFGQFLKLTLHASSGAQRLFDG
jgi:hypothetical protein